MRCRAAAGTRQQHIPLYLAGRVTALYHEPRSSLLASGGTAAAADDDVAAARAAAVGPPADRHLLLSR